MKPSANTIRVPAPATRFPSEEQDFVRLVNLSKSYQEGNTTRTVLQGVNLQMHRGEFIAILGRSGSGKTTLLNLVSGVDHADQGEIRVANFVLTQMSEEERTAFRRRHIGFIFQFFNLIPTLTVWENLILPLILNGLTSTADMEWAKMLLETVGLAGCQHSFPDNLSGGEQQRVAIARALVHRPLLVLADEPTGNLDEDNARIVLDLLSQLLRQQQSTLIMVTHSQDAAALADRVFALKEGRLQWIKNNGQASTHLPL